MKKIKLFTPLLTFSAIAATIIPTVACNPQNTFSVTVVDTKEKVSLENTTAEGGKKFESKVNIDTTFVVDQVVIKVGDKTLVEGQQFIYSRFSNTLVIYENVIDNNVTIAFTFQYVMAGYIRADWYAHDQYLISDSYLKISDVSKSIVLFMRVDYSNWTKDTNYPKNFHIVWDESKEAATIIDVKCITDSSTITLAKDEDDKGFHIDEGKIDKETIFDIEIVCKVPSPNTEYRVWGYQK